MRTLSCAMSGGLGMLFFAGIALTQEKTVADVTGPNPVEAGLIDMREIDRVDECLDAQVCIDRYLWSLYERTQKIDAVKVPEQIKVAVKRKGKTRMVAKTISKFMLEDFAWKDPDAARRAGMSPRDFVIGGMDPAFRVRLYHALRALEDAGMMPGITSAFRDDYRQTIASGQKALNDRSFHGGSFRGGYGHGQAADIVSIKGATRAERLAASEEMWKWIDAHEQDLGIGRPYLDRDAPHVGPIDGREYFAHRIEPKMLQAQRAESRARHAPSKAKSPQRIAQRSDRGLLKRAKATKPARAQSRSMHST